MLNDFAFFFDLASHSWTVCEWAFYILQWHSMIQGRIEQETGRRKQENDSFNIRNARIDPATDGIHTC
jgi:hypothetical protein